MASVDLRTHDREATYTAGYKVLSESGAIYRAATQTEKNEASGGNDPVNYSNYPGAGATGADGEANTFDWVSTSCCNDTGTFAELVNRVNTNTFFSVEGEVAPNTDRNGLYFISETGPRQLHAWPEPAALSVTTSAQADSEYVTRITTVAQYGSGIYSNLRIDITFGHSTQGARTVSIEGPIGALGTVTDSLSLIPATGTVRNVNGVEVAGVPHPNLTAIVGVQGSVEDVYIVNSVADFYGDITINVTVTDSNGATATDNTALSDVGFVSNIFEHDATAGSDGVFDPLLAYTSTNHVPEWTGGFVGATASPSEPAANVTADDIVLKYAPWGLKNIQIKDTGITASDITDMREFNSLISMFNRAEDINPDTSQWDTANITNMSFMFADADIATPDVSGFDTSKVTHMWAMFNRALIADPDVSGFDTSNVVNMRFMFNGMTIADPDVSGFVTDKVTTMASMFREMPVANPNVTSFDTSSVVDFEWMFGNAPMANPDVSGFDTSSATKMGQMFFNATSFTGSVAGFDITSLESAENMFSGTDMGTANYDALLIAWSGQAFQPNVTFHAGAAKYTAGGAAEAGRNALTAAGWVITDGGAV